MVLVVTVVILVTLEILVAVLIDCYDISDDGETSYSSDTSSTNFNTNRETVVTMVIV